MCIDEYRQHAQRLVALDKAHPAHVGGKVVDVACVSECLCAGIDQTKIRNSVLRLTMDLIPLIERLQIHRPDLVAVTEQVGDEMTPDEASTACDYSQITAHQTSLPGGRSIALRGPRRDSPFAFLA